MKTIFAMFLMIGLAGCATQQMIQTSTLAPLAPVPVPVISPLVLNPVQWQVMNSADIEILAAQLKASNADNVYFVLDEINYKNLDLNLNSIDSYIQQETTNIELLDTINAARASETTVPAKTK